MLLGFFFSLSLHVVSHWVESLHFSCASHCIIIQDNPPSYINTGFYEAEIEAVRPVHSFSVISTHQINCRAHPDSRKWRNRVCYLSGEKQVYIAKKHVGRRILLWSSLGNIPQYTTEYTLYIVIHFFTVFVCFSA